MLIDGDSSTQSYKRSLGTNPHQLGEYRDLVTELQQIAGKQE